MADYNISAEITADTKGFESGVKKAQSASKKLGKSITDVVKGFGKSGLSGAITSAGLALGGIGLAVGTAVKAIKGITKALGECAEAYKVQLQAERALDTAINNSPYVSGTASKALKDFASEMQKVSNLGDEEIIPQMTQLITTSRTEAEVMKIIATASDMSASGTMSFDQAVTQLNATLNGNIGRLGQQNAELKGLTDEELKSGKAVEILGEKYKGLAQATVDTKKQLQNAIGDLKETFGSVFEKAMTPMRKFFIEIIQGWADARKAKQEYEGAMIAIEKGEATANDYRIKEKKLLEEIEAVEGDLRKQAEELGMPYEEAYNLMADWQRAQLEAMKEELDNTRLLAKMHEGLEKIKQKEAEWAQEEADRRQAEIDKETKIADLKTEYLQKIAEQEAKWKNIEDVTGEQISNEEKIAFYQDSLVDLMTKAGGQITTNSQLYKDQMAIIEKLAEGLEKQKKALADISSWESKLRQQSIEALSNQNRETEDYEKKKRNLKKILDLSLQQLDAQLNADLKSVEDTENVEEAKTKILEYYNNEKLALQKDYNEQVADIQRDQEEEVWREQKAQYQKMAQTLLNYTSKIENAFVSMARKIGAVVRSAIGKMFSGAKGGLGKLFDLNPDTALEGLLKLEDKILTFFVETLPKLPTFLASAMQSIMQSISVLIKNILSSGGFLNLGELLGSMLSNLINQIPQIIRNIIPEIIRNIIPVIKGIVSAVLSTLSNMDIFGQLLDMIVGGFEWLLDSIVSALPTILKGLVSFVEKVAKKLPQIIKVIIPALSNVIVSIVKVLPSLLKAVLPNVLRAVLELVKELLKETPVIVKEILNAMPEIISAVIEGITEFLSNLTAKDIATFVSGVIQAVIQIASSLIKNIGKIVVELIPLMAQIIIELIKSVPDIIEGLWSGVWEGAKDLGETIWSGIKSAGEAIKDIGTSIGNGIKKLFGFATGTQSAPKGLALVGEAGPELVRFNGGEQVLNTRNTQKALAGAGGNTNNFNVVFNNLQDTSAYAMMSQLRQYNRQMAINGVI